MTDANDDEVNAITGGKENQFVSTSNSKPGLLPDAQTTAFNKKLNLGLPSQGTFSDPHGGQNQPSSTGDLSSTDGFQKSLSAPSTASFEPISATGAQYSSAFVDQQVAKSVGKEQI